MPKSKEFLSSSEESDSGSDVPKKKKAKVEKEAPKKVEKKEEKVEKKAKSSDKDKGASSQAEKGPNGETMFQLARMRFATVSEFRGKVLVSVREYYEKDGNMLPGKKGISLSLEQWNALKEHMDDIDETIKKM